MLGVAMTSRQAAAVAAAAVRKISVAETAVSEVHSRWRHQQGT